MYSVFIAGKVRGFFKHLLNIQSRKVRFISESKPYEVKSSAKTIISRIIKMRIVGIFGVYSTIKVKEKDQNFDCVLSFNRFAKTKKPYIIYLENPTALCNYSLYCIMSPFAKRRLKRDLSDVHLKKIICMSDACKNTVSRVLGVSVPEGKLCTIYPYVPNNKFVNENFVRQRCKQDKLKVLYISQGARFYSKGGLEIIDAYEKLKKKFNITLTIITNTNCLTENLKKKVKELNIDLREFSFPYQELEKIYADCHILLQPSSDDSFGLTVLEAMKAGLPAIVSNMYAFKEMITDGYNGFHVNPSYRFFDENNIPNYSVWNHRKKTIYSNRLNSALSEQLEKKIEMLYKDRHMLENMSVNSYRKAINEFGEDTILKQWENLETQLLGK